MPFAITSLDDISRWARGELLEIVLIVTGAILLARFASWIRTRITSRIDARTDRDDELVLSESSKHRHAVAQVVTWVAIVLVSFIAGILVLERLGVPLTALVAPATVAGVAIGFGAQRLVQDLLAGFFIVTERQYGFGDVIRVSALGAVTGVTGTVEDVTLRVTRLRTANGEVVIVPNGQIVQVTNLSRDWARAVVDVPVPATVDIDRVNAVLERVGHELFDDAAFRRLLLDRPTVMGVETIEMNQFKVRVVARTLPGKQFEVGRALRARITLALRQDGIILTADLEAAEPSGAT